MHGSFDRAAWYLEPMDRHKLAQERSLAGLRQASSFVGELLPRERWVIRKVSA